MALCMYFIGILLYFFLLRFLHFHELLYLSDIREDRRKKNSIHDRNQHEKLQVNSNEFRRKATRKRIKKEERMKEEAFTMEHT